MHTSAHFDVMPMLVEWSVMSHYDVTLTGHVIYELSTGRELGVEFPGEGDYKMVKRKEQVVQILTFIFNTSAKVDNRSVSYQEGLKDVRHMHVTCMSHACHMCSNPYCAYCFQVKLHSFFSDLRLGGDLDTNSQNIKVTIWPTAGGGGGGGGHVTTGGCHMTGTLQVGVAEEVQAFLDKVRAKRNVAKLSRKVSVCFRSTANGMCAAEDSSPGIGSDMQVLMTRYSCWVSRLRHKSKHFMCPPCKCII